MKNWKDASRLSVVVGHFGSGKTEFSVNLALELRKAQHPTAIADLDVVDPYFRSRECRELFENQGIQLIASSQACLDADVPSMPAEVARFFSDEELYGVLDIGGDASGARVLARYRRQLKAADHRIVCVINANRPLTDTKENAEHYVKSIETAIGLPINWLVNNTHLCSETTTEDIKKGAELVHQVSDSTGIPVLCHVAPSKIAADVPDFHEPVFPIRIYMKKPWE